MARPLKRNLFLKRAAFFDSSATKKTLEKLLLDVHDMFYSEHERHVTRRSGGLVQCLDCSRSSPFGLMMHLVRYAPRAPMSVIRHEERLNANRLEEMSPDGTYDFWEGDLHVLVAGDHLVTCSSNAHRFIFQEYFVGMAQKMEADLLDTMVTISDVASFDEINAINQVGVSAVKFESSLYEGSIDHIERSSVRRNISSSILTSLTSALSKDASDEELFTQSNIQARVALTYDRRRKGGVLSKTTLDRIAKEVVQDGEDFGFEIELCDGRKIRPKDLVLKKEVDLPRFGKTVAKSSAWDAISCFYEELRDGGYLGK